ncbi:Rtm1p [Colletotrichum asianum]
MYSVVNGPATPLVLASPSFAHRRWNAAVRATKHAMTKICSRREVFMRACPASISLSDRDRFAE